MSMTRFFGSLESFARFLAERAAEMPLGMVEVTAGSANVLERRAKAIFGDNTKLADLAESTQDERVRLGYAANEPLKRDGTLLRDTVEKFSDLEVAGIGSYEEIQAFHEFGYLNWRTGNPVPPRPVFRIALEESLPEIAALVERSVMTSFGFSGVANVLAGAALDTDEQLSLAQSLGYE